MTKIFSKFISKSKAEKFFTAVTEEASRYTPEHGSGTGCFTLNQML